jgi:hypothetical protein
MRVRQGIPVLQFLQQDLAGQFQLLFLPVVLCQVRKMLR